MFVNTDIEVFIIMTGNNGHRKTLIRMIRGERALCIRGENSDFEEAKSINENADITYGNHNGGCARMFNFHLRRLYGGCVFLKNGL